MVKFSLYDEIKKSSQNTPPTKLKPQKTCSILNSLPKEHRDVIYLLILHHEQIQEDGTKGWRCNPYKGHTFDGGKGVKFSWMSLPVPLQNIIMRYLENIEIRDK